MIKQRSKWKLRPKWSFPRSNEKKHKLKKIHSYHTEKMSLRKLRKIWKLQKEIWFVKHCKTLTSLLLLLMLAFFFLISSSALLISSKVTPWVERLVCLTLRAWALRCVSLSSSRTGGTNDLKNWNSTLEIECWRMFWVNKMFKKSWLAKIFLGGFLAPAIDCWLGFMVSFVCRYFEGRT